MTQWWLTLAWLPIACTHTSTPLPTPSKAPVAVVSGKTSKPPVAAEDMATSLRGATDHFMDLQKVDAELSDLEAQLILDRTEGKQDQAFRTALGITAAMQLCVKQGKFLDVVAAERKLDLVAQWQTNPFLQTYQAQFLLLTTLSRCGVQDHAWQQRLLDAVAHEQSQWAKLSDVFSLLGAPLSVPVAPAPGSPAPMAATPTPTPAEEVPLPPVTQQNADIELQEAQHLVDSPIPEERRKAVRIFRAVLSATPAGSPAYGDISDKLTQACEQAVQQLRTLAAKQFQDALPLPDGAAKTDYLMGAKKSLTQALEYKEAKEKTLQRVEENLRMIEESLQKSPTR